ncbi:MAG: hypothetical protein EOP81_08100 [Variovorax sp.]|nr:MAG: hypothetical protein EOP81_08100 [Variovorax sp.]
MASLTPSPRWRLSQLQNLLVLSGGADESYVALVPRDAVRPVLRHAVLWLGDVLPWLDEGLREGCAAEGETPDLVLVIRSNCNWQDALARYADAAPQQPHLLVDLAYHHTVSLGPYVVPGDTACVACLGHRVAHRWGDLPMPAAPAVQQHEALVTALVRQALHGEPGTAARLAWVERVVSLDLRSLASTQDRVFRHPWCPVCSAQPHDDAGAGSLALPWITAP